jgi:hypothetical protein
MASYVLNPGAACAWKSLAAGIAGRGWIIDNRYSSEKLSLVAQVLKCNLREKLLICLWPWQIPIRAINYGFYQQNDAIQNAAKLAGAEFEGPFADALAPLRMMVRLNVETNV